MDQKDAIQINRREVERDSVEAESISNSNDDNSASSGNDGDRWERLASSLLSDLGGAPKTPPTVSPDAMGWYLPLHYYAHDWGIYIRESAIVDMMGMILHRIDDPLRFEFEPLMKSLVRMALSAIYLHEAFHHKCESFAIRLEVVEHTKRSCT